MTPITLRRTLAAALACVGLAACAASAQTDYVKANLVQVDVYDRNDRAALPVYDKDGRHYVVGVPGHEYALRIRNWTAGRVLVVTSVDGVNAISGETASPSQSGYVLEPWGSVEIAGWRKSLSRTAAFYFTDLGDSYAARTGRPQNVGVIGVAVFREKVWRSARPDYDYRNRLAQKDAAEPPAPQAQPAPSAPAASAEASRREMGESKLAGKIGTGHGRSEESNVTVVNFERASTSPAETVVIQYDRRDNLIAMGVLPRPTPYYANRGPNPFPGMRFAPDPR